MKTSRKRLLCLILCLLMILSCVPVVGAEEGASGPDDAEELRLKRKAAMRDDEIELAYDSDTIYTGKWTTLAEDGTYSVELHSFVTGDVTPKPVPMDIVLVMDQSASMTNNAMNETPDTVRFMTNVKGYTYKNLMSQPWVFYYVAADRTYYSVQIQKTTNGTATPVVVWQGEERVVSNSYISNSVSVKNGNGTVSLDGYHYTPNQENFQLTSNSNGYYYYNTNDSTETIGYFSTKQEAFNYMRTTYLNSNYMISRYCIKYQSISFT
jgi:hypothetical protein